MLRFFTRLSGRRRHGCRSCGTPATKSSSPSSTSSASTPSSTTNPQNTHINNSKLDCPLNRVVEDNYDVRLRCCYSRLRSHDRNHDQLDNKDYDHDHDHHHQHDHDHDHKQQESSSSPSSRLIITEDRLHQDSFDDISLTRITGLRTSTSTTIPTRLCSSTRDSTHNNNNNINNNNNNNNINNNNKCGNFVENNNISGKEILQTTRPRTRRETCRDTTRSTVDRLHRRSGIPSYLATILLLSYALFGIADACSSKSTPKPRPPTTTQRPSITFRQNPCPPDYAEWYCLNQATCFTVKIQDSLLYNCLCADGFVGQRCEFKDLEGSYSPSRQRIMLETASIAGGATIAVFLVVIICIAAYIHCKRKQKELRTSSGVDTVDGTGRDPELRPFSSRNRSLKNFMAKNQHCSPIMCPSIEQTRMPSWNVELTRLASVNEAKRSSQ